eukprot:1826348-Lingulodinium_polyedra.AAC.1
MCIRDSVGPPTLDPRRPARCRRVVSFEDRQLDRGHQALCVLGRRQEGQPAAPQRVRYLSGLGVARRGHVRVE